MQSEEWNATLAAAELTLIGIALGKILYSLEQVSHTCYNLTSVQEPPAIRCPIRSFAKNPPFVSYNNL